jgi:structural maintenance of chromosome 3 (chondroitin sulfate proteoglycan 6)
VAGQVQGYYGPLIHLIQCKDVYYTAVEQVGGRQMWNAVVEDENVATQLVNAMKKAKPGTSGRMSFMPLNKLRLQKTTFPEGMRDAEPLVKCIKCDGKFKVAVDQVFGSALLCKDLDVANTYRQQHNLECVTMDGEKVARKGAIKGGFHDTNSSKLKLVKDKQEKRKIQDEKIAEESAAKKAVDNLVQQQQELATQKRITENEQGKAEKEKRHADREKDQLKKEVANLSQDIKSKGHFLDTNKTLEEENQHEINKLDEQLKVPFAQTITEEQRQQLSELNQQHTQLNKRMRTEQDATSQLGMQRDIKWDEKQRTENELQEHKDAVGRLQGQSAQLTHNMAMETSSLEELRKLKEVPSAVPAAMCALAHHWDTGVLAPPCRRVEAVD